MDGRKVAVIRVAVNLEFEESPRDYLTPIEEIAADIGKAGFKAVYHLGEIEMEVSLPLVSWRSKRYAK